MVKFRLKTDLFNIDLAYKVLLYNLIYNLLKPIENLHHFAAVLIFLRKKKDRLLRAVF